MTTKAAATTTRTTTTPIVTTPSLRLIGAYVRKQLLS